MGWSIGYDSRWNRDIGYGVPAFCDHPECSAEIDRGLSYVCGGEPYGGEHGCGLYFCEKHRAHRARCTRCRTGKPPYQPKPEHPHWVHHKLTDESWKQWREENEEEVTTLWLLMAEQRGLIGGVPDGDYVDTGLSEITACTCPPDLFWTQEGCPVHDAPNGAE